MSNKSEILVPNNNNNNTSNNNTEDSKIIQRTKITIRNRWIHIQTDLLNLHKQQMKMQNLRVSSII